MRQKKLWHTLECPYCGHKHDWYYDSDEPGCKEHRWISVDRDLQIHVFFCDKCKGTIATAVTDTQGATFFHPLTKEL